MAVTRDVTGGDLYSLWRVANITLPTVEKVFADQSNVVHECSSADEDKFGRCHSEWARICLSLEIALSYNAVMLKSASVGLTFAVSEFAFTDGETSAQITSAGQELIDILSDPNLHDPDDNLTGDERPGPPSDPDVPEDH
ncbi:hypothetical protein LX16_1350 [Stackebrandtia albiflava]|uniref:Uncharacterized protein n=1 Tax=Stackebrandtia albiflava TaxID=406432 RepID=A0A562VCN4_9ACTN|nr:hypothetical protein [Stackebrandtia albiflava]TWJ15639.1 hypothetical protein LX16_1350 [Stackebrandtia albiflava]